MVKKVVKKVKTTPKKGKKVTKKLKLTSEPYDRDDMVSVELNDLDLDTYTKLKNLMLKGGYGSISEVVRDIFRRLMLGDPPPRELPKLSQKEFAKRLSLKSR